MPAFYTLPRPVSPQLLNIAIEVLAVQIHRVLREGANAHCVDYVEQGFRGVSNWAIQLHPIVHEKDGVNKIRLSVGRGILDIASHYERSEDGRTIQFGGGALIHPEDMELDNVVSVLTALLIAIPVVDHEKEALVGTERAAQEVLKEKNGIVLEWFHHERGQVEIQVLFESRYAFSQHIGESNRHSSTTSEGI